MLKVNDEINSLLTSFAMTVSSVREQAERDAIGIRSAAEAYAEERRAAADRLFHEAQDRAKERAEDILRRAREEVTILTRGQATVEEALNEVAKGFYAWMTSFDRLREMTGPTERTSGDVPRRTEWNRMDDRTVSPAGDEHPMVVTDATSPVDEHDYTPLDPVQIDPGQGIVVDFDPPADVPGEGGSDHREE
jgi:hypothetical protein